MNLKPSHFFLLISSVFHNHTTEKSATHLLPWFFFVEKLVNAGFLYSVIWLIVDLLFYKPKKKKKDNAIKVLKNKSHNWYNVNFQRQISISSSK
jgi:hypothetical protein